ncbi:MAG: T9SS type A sorting domain-containing protein [Candidatus Kapaibacterium sp.]
MRFIPLTFLLFLSLPVLLLSKISFENDTIGGTNSEVIDIRINVNELVGESLLEFDLIVSNPSVCYITDIMIDSKVLSSTLIAKDEGVFSIKMRVEEVVTGFTLKAKLLSGYDSTTTISIQNVVINGEQSSNDTIVIQNNYAYGIGTYIRFIENSLPYPNPLKSGDISSIEFTNDTDIELDLIICDTKGEVLRNEKLSFSKGRNSIEINTEDYAAGVYFISANSEIGSFYERIVVYK